MLNYGSGIVTVVVSIILGFFVKDINSVMQWIVSALWGGYVVSNILKWYWWRFNGSGYFWGMLSGIVPAVFFPILFPDTLELYLFPLLLLITTIGSVVGTYLEPATDTAILVDFYKKTHPWGFWKPILAEVRKEDPNFQPNKNFKMDMFNVGIGIIAQTLLVIMPLYLVLHQFNELWISTAVLVVTLVILKKTWWNKLKEQS